MPSQTLQLNVFPGGLNLPLWAGIENGIFQRHGLDVRLHFTSSSVEQLGGLVRGEWDLGLTAFDNVVAYQEGQGEAALDREPDLFAFMGGDNGFLRLVVQGDVAGYPALRGRTLSVDAMTTGFAFVLRKMLSRNGLAEDAVRFERAGGVLQRWEALKAGKHAGTLLLTPFELIAQKMGLKLLQSASDVLPRYQGVVGTARRSWAERNGPALVAFISSYLESLDWLFAPQNRAAAAALLAAKAPGMTPELAAATCAIFLAPGSGFERRAALDFDGMRTVLELRSEYGRPQKTLAEPHRYVDARYYDQALGRHV